MTALKLITAALAGMLAFPAHAVDLTGKPRVIDGDTIEIAGQRIRLHGIDAPEADQTCTDKDGKKWRCGLEATFALARIIEFHWITCKGDKRDRYGRLIAVCYAGPYDLSAKMVRQGSAGAERTIGCSSSVTHPQGSYPWTTRLVSTFGLATGSPMRLSKPGCSTGLPSARREREKKLGEKAG